MTPADEGIRQAWFDDQTRWELASRGEMIRQNDSRQIQRADYIRVAVLCRPLPPPYKEFDAWRRRELSAPDINQGSDNEDCMVIWHFGCNYLPPERDLIEVIW